MSTEHRIAQRKDEIVLVDPDLSALAAHAATVPEGISYSQRAYDIILGAILNRIIPSGRRLAEIPVARAINVGRTPVREALLRLESDGFVRSETRIGMVVASNTVESFADIYEVCESLEALASRLAARYARSVDHMAFQRILNEAELPTLTRDVTRLRLLNTRYHEAIQACGRNNQLRQTLRQLINQLRLSPISAYDVPGHADKAMAEHRAILEAIIGHDEECAAQLTADHLRREKEVRLEQLALAELRDDI